MALRNVKLEVYLYTDSTPLSGKTINFYHKLSSESTWTSDGSEVTNDDGYASKTISLDVPNTYDFRAEFPGDEDYEGSLASVLNFRVKAKTSLTLTVTPL